MDYQIPFSQLCFLSTELILYVILILIILRQLFTEFLCRLSSSRTWSKFHENEENDSYLNFRSSFPSEACSFSMQILVIVLLQSLFSLKSVWQCMRYKLCLYLSAVGRTVLFPGGCRSFWAHHLRVSWPALLSYSVPPLYPTYWQYNQLKLPILLHSSLRFLSAVVVFWALLFCWVEYTPL